MNKPLKVYLGKSNAAKLQTVIAAKTFLKDTLGCQIVEWSSTTSQATNDRNLLSCDLMYIIPDPLPGVLGKGLYESITRFKACFNGKPVVMERDNKIISIGEVKPTLYSKDWSRYAGYTIEKSWATKKLFFIEKFDIQTVFDGLNEFTFATEKNPKMVTVDIETLPGATIYKNAATGEVQFKRSEVNDIFEPVKPIEAPSGILYYMDVIYTSWEDDPYAMLLIELL